MASTTGMVSLKALTIVFNSFKADDKGKEFSHRLTVLLNSSDLSRIYFAFIWAKGVETQSDCSFLQSRRALHKESRVSISSLRVSISAKLEMGKSKIFWYWLILSPFFSNNPHLSEKSSSSLIVKAATDSICKYLSSFTFVSIERT